MGRCDSMKWAHATSTRCIYRPKSPGPSVETPVCRVAPGAAPASLRSSPRYLPCLRPDASHSSAPDATRVARLNQCFPSWIIASMLLAAGPLSAGMEESRNIRAAVDAFVRAQTESLPGHVEIKSGLVDPQLKFTQCEHVEAFLPPGSKLWGNAAGGGRWETRENWSFYVPVQIRVYAD